MMEDNIHKLRVAKRLTPIEEVRADVVALLEETLEEAKRGEIDEIAIMAKCKTEDDDDQWIERASPTFNFRAWIGAIELLKASWIENYRDFVL